MKRIWMTVLALVMLVGVLSGCGEKKTDETVDFTAFYTELADKYDWDENFLIDLNDEMLDSYYPGLRELSTKQLIAKVPQISSVVNELVFVECETEDDAKKAAEILQKRVDDQAGGGAWYPESMESWGNAQVYTNGKYAALIASAEHQQEIGDAYNGLFA